VRTADLDYDLPPGLIAQTPAEPRPSSRLLVHDRAARETRHRRFADLLDELRPDDLVVVNDTRVLPVRVHARRATGGAVELLLLEPLTDGAWEALARPYARLHPGETVTAADDAGFRIDERLGEGRVRVTPVVSGSLEGVLRRVGEMPLPPYIHEQPADPERYQTVYAQDPGSAAAPTAGLHFDDGLWAELNRRHQVVAVTLGVGLDTFRPVSEDDLDQHAIHSEPYRVTDKAGAAVDDALAQRRRVVAVGTTAVRVLETVWGDPPAPLEGRTRLFITPGHRFRAVGAMVTNFHLPRSTLLALVMAFAGIDETRALYRTAIAERYRFYSFGDACLIL
jgi:S-adenosylmethionine:tRNA ribosyltransferase-isomerase